MTWIQLDIIASFVVCAGMIIAVAVELNKRTARLTAITKKQNEELHRTLEAMLVLTDIVAAMAKEGAENANRKKK